MIFLFPFSYPGGRNEEVNRAAYYYKRPSFDVKTREIEMYSTEGTAPTSGRRHHDIICVWGLLYMFIAFLPILLIWRKLCITLRVELHYR